MSATIESEESDFGIMDVISCVAIFYEKGKGGFAFCGNKKFWAQLSRNMVSLKALRQTVR